MCAIIGWAGTCKRGQWRQIHNLLTNMLVVSESRGTHASGFAAIDAKRGFVVDKRPVPSRVFVALSTKWRRLSKASCLIAHCRAATHGSPRTGDNRNNHPFANDSLAIVVNGMAGNFRAVAEQNGLRLHTECDSEVVLRLIENEGNVPQGLSTCLYELSGGLAAAALDVQRRSVWVARNEDRPAWLLRFAGIQGAFVCSTRDIVEESVHRAWGRAGLRLIEHLAPIAADIPIELTSSGIVLAARASISTPPSFRGLRLT